jgi:hypothetical protein
MDDYESLSHTKWECKYHVVIPECHPKVRTERFAAIRPWPKARPGRCWAGGWVTSWVHCQTLPVFMMTLKNPSVALSHSTVNRLTVEQQGEPETLWP